MRRVVIASTLVASTTGCKQPTESPPDMPLPELERPEPELEPPKLEQPKLEQPEPPDHGVYVAVAGGEFDGHAIPALLFKQTEVTVAEYRACFDWGECSKPHDGELCNRSEPDREQHPINCVSWSQARDYCAWAGGRLPTRWEWEWAARGREAARPYPWGREPTSCARTVMFAEGPGCGTHATWPVGSKADGASVDGLHDMVGNVWEWTASPDERGGLRTVKGGSWFVQNPSFMRVDYALTSPVDGQSPGDGFRCVRDLSDAVTN